MPLKRMRSSNADFAQATNILNGVAACAWDRTSAVPKLLEVVNDSQVRFNIDTFNPLILRFADGWDDYDRPKGIAKQIDEAPLNLDLSSYANCQLQIVAKIINDELIFEEHIVYDPNWSTWVGIIPSFASGYEDVAPFDSSNGNASTKDGWTVRYIPGTSVYSSSYYPRLAVDNNNSTQAKQTTWGSNSIEIIPPYALSICRFYHKSMLRNNYIDCASGGPNTVRGYDPVSSTWKSISGDLGTSSKDATVTLTNSDSLKAYTKFRYPQGCDTSGNTSYVYTLQFYERPFVQFSPLLNQVKDTEDNIVKWINLGCVTIDASGIITELVHYVDIRNNFPGGMRVEA